MCSLQAPWLYMIESDYVFMKPLQLPVDAGPEVDGWAFRFQYIQPRSHRVRANQYRMKCKT